jgi:hypothetical protein
MSGLDVLRLAIIITSCREPRHEPDVEAILAEGIRAELVSARAEGQFVAAFGADDRPPRYYRVFIELHKFLPSKKTRRTSGGLEIYWQAPRARCHCHLEGLVCPLG